MKLLIDADLLLEAIINRFDANNEFALVWKLPEFQEIEIYITEIGLDKVISIARALAASEDEADTVTALISSLVKICYIESSHVKKARSSQLKDFESALELICAEIGDYLALITHRPKEFLTSPPPRVHIWTMDRLSEFVGLSPTMINLLKSSSITTSNEDIIKSQFKYQNRWAKLIKQFRQLSNHLRLNLHVWMSTLRKLIFAKLDWSLVKLSKRHYPKIEQVKYEDLFYPKELERFLSNPLVKVRQGLAANHNILLIGRDSTLNRIRDFLSPQSNSSVLLLYGGVGTGKTSLATHAAMQPRFFYGGQEGLTATRHNKVIYVSYAPYIWQKLTGVGKTFADDDKRVEVDYLGQLARVLAKTLQDDSINRVLPAEQWNRILSTLDDQETILILDGVDLKSPEFKKIYVSLGEIPSSIRIMMTSREQNYQYSSLRHSSLEVTELSKEESQQLIYHHIQRTDVVLRSEEVEQVNQCCLGNPLAIACTILQLSNGGKLDFLVANAPKDKRCIAGFFCEQLTYSLREKFSAILLKSLSLAPAGFRKNTLLEVAGLNSEDDLEFRGAIAELQRLSLIEEKNGRYTLGLDLYEALHAQLIQTPELVHQLHERLLHWSLLFAQQHGGKDWGDWYINYDQLEREWETFQLILNWCAAQYRYQDIKHLWRYLNHFADLYGYWRDRLIWLNWLIKGAKDHQDWAEYVSALSRKSWTLIMLNQASSLAEANQVLQEAWQLREKADLETQSYLAHHRVVLYNRQKRYEDARQALFDQQQIMGILKEARLDKQTWERHCLNMLRDQAKFEYKQDQLDIAQQHYEELLERSKTVNWLRGACYAHYMLAEIALKQNDLKLAESHLRKGLPIAKRNKNRRRIAEYERSFAELENLRGDAQTSRNWANRATNHFINIGMDEEGRKLSAKLLDI